MNTEKILSPIDLGYNPISSKEELALQKFVKEYKHVLFSKVLLMGALFAISGLFSFDIYQKSGDTTEPLFLFSALVDIITLLSCLVCIIKWHKISTHSYTRADYGVVKKKNDYKGKNYITVFFPYPNGVIEEVMCFKELWNRLQENDLVLVISFDDKRSFVVGIKMEDEKKRE